MNTPTTITIDNQVYVKQSDLPAGQDIGHGKMKLILIRSLREELAEARDAERDRIAQYVLHLCYIDLAKAIRNNEHRSDT